MVSTAAFHARVRGSVPGLGGLKETKMFLPHPRVKVSIVGSLRDREVACSASDRQGSNFESCVWRTVSSQSSHHPQEVLLAQFSLYVHKGGLKPDSFHTTLLICKSRRNSPSKNHLRQRSRYHFGTAFIKRTILIRFASKLIYLNERCCAFNGNDINGICCNVESVKINFIIIYSKFLSEIIYIYIHILSEK